MPFSAVRPAAFLVTQRKPLSSSYHTWQGTDRKRHFWLPSLNPETVFLPVTPFAFIMFVAAFVTAVFRISLPTAFIRREFRARFCLLVPKASMHKSICARDANENTLLKWRHFAPKRKTQLTTTCSTFTFSKKTSNISLGTTQPCNKHWSAGGQEVTGIVIKPNIIMKILPS